MLSPQKSFTCLLSAILLVCGMSWAAAQDKDTLSSSKERIFRRFKVGVGIPFSGLALGNCIGVSVAHLEPQYAITDHIGIGLSYDASLWLTTDCISGYGHALTLYGDYFFTTTRVRPSVGLGLGYYYLTEGVTDPGGGFNISPRIRLSMDHSVLRLTYHHIFDRKDYYFSGGPYRNISRHFAIQWGLEIGGGRKKKKQLLTMQDKSNTNDSKKSVFRRFKVEVGVALPLLIPSGIAIGKSGDGFYTFHFEPQYAITEHIGVGLRYDHSSLANDPCLPEGHAFTLYGDYFFTTTPFITTFLRPSVGLGLGYYSLTDAGSSCDEEPRGGFNISPRARLNIGPFVLGLTYHHIYDGKDYRHIAIQWGWEWGGGRKKKKQ